MVVGADPRDPEPSDAEPSDPEPSDPEPRDAAGAPPDVAGTIVGWRTWNVTDPDDPILCSPLALARWPARVAMQATCTAPHPAPAEGCTCGLYAARDPWTAIRAGGAVLGCVSLWGEVVEGERGWRAARGYPRLLITGPEVPPATRSRLATRYGVGVHVAEVAPADLRGLVVVDRAHDNGLGATAEALRGTLADAPGSPADVAVPVARLLEFMRPGAIPQSLRGVLLALAGICLLPDVWACLTAGATALLHVDSGWTVVPGVVLGIVLVYGLRFLALPVVAAARVLRAALCAFGRAGLPLWRGLVGLGLAAVPIQVLAVWELLAHRHPAWVSLLLFAPGLVLAAGLVPWALTRPSAGRSRHRPLVAAAACVVLVAATTAGCLATTRPAVLGEDLWFDWNTGGFWNATIASDTPPGTCLSDRDRYEAADEAAVIECSSQHWGEIAGYAPLGPPPYPGDDQAAAQGAFACERLAAGEGLDPGLGTDTISPGASTWNGDRRGNDVYATCAVSRRDRAPLGPGTHVDTARHAPDQPVTMSLYDTSPGDSAPLGSCVATALGPTADIHEAPVVTCDRPHWGEILDDPSISAPGAPWPGDEATATAAQAACRRAATDRRLPPDVPVDDEYPNAAFWHDMAPRGVHVVCVAHRADNGAVTGPLR